jgi:hypothetical protein
VLRSAAVPHEEPLRFDTTREKMVLYRGLYESPDLREEYGDNPLFVRPFDMFNESVEVDGKITPRFAYISPTPDPPISLVIT